MNLLRKIENYPKKLTRSELHIAHFASEHYPQGVLEPAKYVAKRLNISTATVVRFVGKLGYDSYAQLQAEARAEVASKLSSPLARAHLSLQVPSGLEASFEGTYAADASNLARAYTANTVDDFQRVIDTLISKDVGKVYLLAAKNSYAVVHYLYTYLNLCLPDVVRLSAEDGVLADGVLRASSRDVLFAVSIRRYSRNTIRAAQYFKKIGAKVVCITDSRNSPIAAVADASLLIEMSSLSPFDSYIAAFSLTNAIGAAIATKRREPIAKTLERGEEILRHFNVFDE